MMPTQDPSAVALPHGRDWNFSAGPGMLPLEVLEEAKEDLLNYKGTGSSVMEMSHRGKTYDDIHMAALADLRSLMRIPEGWGVLFLQGGASLQNALVPMNLAQAGKTPNYITTGYWGNASKKDAAILGPVHDAYSSEGTHFDRAPADSEPRFSADAAYAYFTSNETVDGVDFLRDPKFAVDAPIVCDASSNILSRHFDLSRYDVIFAGAQKNQGPAGVTTVILSPRALDIAGRQNLPMMLSWSKAHKNHSIHNTPPCFAVYMCGLYYKWLLRHGGIDWIIPINERKAKAIYDVIDGSGGFYTGHAVRENRSLMNITFKCPTEALDEQFASEAKAEKLTTLAGHRSIGGIRLSMYNAFPEEGAGVIASFMTEFARRNG
jgi:phosphoserine aminotransferase